jgi:uncharacterized RDD family membrane protein YckC
VPPVDDPTVPAPVPGVRLGLPAQGPGSVASWGRRIGALLLDWLLANLVLLVLVRDTTPWTAGSDQALWSVGIWVVLVALATGLTGASAGQHLLNLRVIRLDRQRVGLWNALVRTLLIALVVPPVVSDRDRRGLHDLTVGTVVVNGPRAS